MLALADERINRHRAWAELVRYHSNWLPAIVTVFCLAEFCDHAERFLRGDAQPPLFVRLYWRFKHWRWHRQQPVEKPSGTLTGTPIPLAFGETIHTVDLKTGKPNVFAVEPVKLPSGVSAYPTGIGSFPRPNCPRCGRSHPELGTPLDPYSPNGWGDSYFTCHGCQYRWNWKTHFPNLIENRGKESGILIKGGPQVPVKLDYGLTIDELNNAVYKIALAYRNSQPFSLTERGTLFVTTDEGTKRLEELTRKEKLDLIEGNDNTRKYKEGGCNHYDNLPIAKQETCDPYDHL